jgi:formylmethanofuran dehydrogenase subunit E
MTDKIWKECIAFHGHSCPGLAMGYRAAMIAMNELGIAGDRSKDEELVCVSENDACGIDAIQWITGCTLGKGNMTLRLTGKHAYSFYDRRTGKSVRVVVKPFDRSAYSAEALTDKLINGPVQDFFDIKETTTAPPERARMFNSIVCEKCGEAVREDLIRLRDGKKVCLDCFREYDNRWSGC